jgi:hypothetical protein
MLWWGSGAIAVTMSNVTTSAADSGAGFYTQGLKLGPFVLSRRGLLLSGGFGSGHREGVVGDEFQVE